MDLKNYKCDGQLSLFDLTKKHYKITKPIRLIELFAGVGSQAMALRDIGANFEHYRVVEFDKYAIASYNAIHGTDFPAMDVTEIKGEDLGITDKLNFTYLLTYSFPCTDLSTAGKMLGMAEGSGTRSSLLWEVKRLLDESPELPQILLMENVPQVHSKANMPHFQKWLDYLESKGYSTYWKDMNAKNYGVAQSRNRTIAVSILGDYLFDFPKPYVLDKTMNDYLEVEVDEKYYLKSDKVKDLIDKLIKGVKLSDEFEKYKNDKANYKPFDNAISYPLHSQDFVRTGFQKISPTLSARDYKDPKIITEVIESKILALDEQNQNIRTETFGTLTTDGSSPKHNNRVIEIKQATKEGYIPCVIGAVVDLNYPDSKTRRGRVIENGNVSPTLTTGNIPSVIEDWLWEIDGEVYLIRIRKLTPKECWRLMDFKDFDFEKAEKVNSNTQLYKQAGNSIVKNVLCEVFKQLF